MPSEFGNPDGQVQGIHQSGWITASEVRSNTSGGKRNYDKCLLSPQGRESEMSSKENCSVWIKKLSTVFLIILSLVISSGLHPVSQAQDPLPPEVKTVTSFDGTPIAYRDYLCENPKGVILLFHGIQSHGGWYERSSQMLADNGYCVYFPDRRGAGAERPLYR